ncbi:MAG: potassium channel beta subunit family protein [Parachlamydiaceae bacterium]
MEYRSLGRSGLKISELSFGSWITFGTKLDLHAARQCMRIAYDAGVNFFDNAEAYGEGAAELFMGEALREFKRENVVVSTKIFWGGREPNQTGLSWKHLVEGAKNSLRRLQLDYVDLLFCHRPDPSTPIEETMRAIDYLGKEGLFFYWGTSEWSAKEIERAHQIAKEYNLRPPTMEQPQYNLFCRERVEKEYLPLYDEYGMGTTIWSPLAFGVLTGKYNEGLSAESRLKLHQELQTYLTPKHLEQVKALSVISNELNCSLAELAIAWCLKNQHVSTVIIGASSPEQLQENLRAKDLKQRLTDEVMHSIAAIF